MQNQSISVDINGREKKNRKNKLSGLITLSGFNRKSISGLNKTKFNWTILKHFWQLLSFTSIAKGTKVIGWFRSNNFNVNIHIKNNINIRLNIYININVHLIINISINTNINITSLYQIDISTTRVTSVQSTEYYQQMERQVKAIFRSDSGKNTNGKKVFSMYSVWGQPSRTKMLHKFNVSFYPAWIWKAGPKWYWAINDIIFCRTA